MNQDKERARVIQALIEATPEDKRVNTDKLLGMTHVTKKESVHNLLAWLDISTPETPDFYDMPTSQVMAAIAYECVNYSVLEKAGDWYVIQFNCIYNFNEFYELTVYQNRFLSLDDNWKVIEEFPIFRKYKRPKKNYLPYIADLTYILIHVIDGWKHNNGEYNPLINNLPSLLNFFITPGQEVIRDFIINAYATKTYAEDAGSNDFEKAINAIRKLEEKCQKKS